MRKYILIILALTLWNIAPAHAVTIEDVTSAKGIHAWLVEDHKLPLIALQFAFRGGVEQDPVDKQGLATLTMNLLAEGAGDKDAEAFQQELADHSITMEFEAGRDAVYGSVKTLAADKDTAFDLLHLALTRPRFDDAAIERLRARQMTSLHRQLGDPDWQARYALFHDIFGAHPYGERRLGTTETLAHITRADITAFAAHHLARDNLIVAAAGDITPEQLAALLDRIFGDLPENAQLEPIAEFTGPEKSAMILVPRAGTQTELMFALPGPKRDDPEWYAAEIANYILGGGGFSSRLMQDVRDKNGLTYGIDTGLSASEHAGLIVGNAATDNDKTAKAWTIATQTMRNFYDKGATEAEITAAKDYLTGAMPLAMTSTDKIAGELVEIQIERLGRDYLDRYDGFIRGVTAEDIAHAIKHWFDPARVTLAMVGKPEGMNPTQTEEPMRQ